ncbi:MAG: hypothetical protein AAF907_14185, partial [Planctomycetota bacterium]
MRSAAAPNAPAEPSPRGAATPSVVSWLMLIAGVAMGVVFGQFSAGRAVEADLYALKKDVAQLRRSADALTAAGGRSGEVATLLEDLRAQRIAVKEASESWQTAGQAIARADRLHEQALGALTSAEKAAKQSAGVSVAASEALAATESARDA